MNLYPAYLVMWIDTTTIPPTITDAGVYGEETPSTSSFTKRHPIPILKVMSTVSYERARNAVIDHCNRTPYYAWLKPLLRL